MSKITLLTLVLCFALTSVAQQIDIDLLKQIHLHRATSLDAPLRTITDNVTPIVIGVPTLMTGIAFLRKDTLAMYKGLYICATVMTNAVLTKAIKEVVNRERPFVTYPIISQETGADSPSFPSGHTANSFALATSLSLYYPKWYVIAPAFVWAGTVGYSRMHLGVHYPSDVLGGIIVGVGTAYLAKKGQEWITKKRTHKVILP